MSVGDAATRTSSSVLDEESSSNISETEVSRLVAQPVETNSGFPQKDADSNSCEKAKESIADIGGQSITQVVSRSSSQKRKEIDRGRSYEQGPRYSNPLSRAESLSRRKDAAIEIDVRPIEKRSISRSSTFFEDPTDPCGALDDHLLEPCPYESLCNSMSEVLSASIHEKDGLFPLHRSRTRSSSNFSLVSSSHALTAAFNECRALSPAATPLPEPLTQSRPNILQPGIQAGEVSLTLGTTHDAPISAISVLSQKIPVPYSLFGTKFPTEILQQVYYNLSLADFNAARHTCRLWYITSLDDKLLDAILRRGGFSSNCLTNESVEASCGSRYLPTKEWLMSKRISRECALGPDWTGNGVCDGAGDLTEALKKSSFVQTSSADFTELAVHYPGPNSAGTIFTVSSCGRFLMTANGCLVYIYELNRKSSDNKPSSGHLRPITSIICPRRVLASSMDTSSHRYAIAILMEGRMGLVCDISALHSATMQQPRPKNSQRVKSCERPRVENRTASQLCGTSFSDRVLLNSSTSTTGASRPPFVYSRTASLQPESTPFEEECWQDIFNDGSSQASRTVGSNSRRTSLSRPSTSNPEDHHFSSAGFSKEWINANSTPMLIETSSRSLYRHLCSDDDPPRSVAICPQRRCVAFGCSSGIELHWVDALTGQDLNRWFPLTAPSDFLYFLPPRRSIDSAKKLRLISSAAKPGERAAIADRSFGGRTRSSPFWERLGVAPNDSDEFDACGILTQLRGEAQRSLLTGRMDTSDHYKAIPLSDGYHILFTDPSTGFLCLGSDAPVGGPTKLLRKVWFQGPTGMGSPVHYAGGSNLSMGVRVVAAFGSGMRQSIWFYSVPSDIFAANQNDQTVYPLSSWANLNSIQDLKCNEWVNWWPDDGLQKWRSHSYDPVPGVLPRTIWPVKIRGQMIGNCNGLVDLSIDSGPCMTIWAFSNTGVALIWKLDDGRCDNLKKSLIMRDGTVREEDGEGNIEMLDSPTDNISERIGDALPSRSESFDGNASFMADPNIDAVQIPGYRYPNNDADGDIFMNDFSNDHPKHPKVDAEGDIIMDDVFYNGHSRTSSQAWEDLVVRQFGGDLWHQREEYLRQNSRGSTVGYAEELTGLVRIDIEIQ